MFIFIRYGLFLLAIMLAAGNAMAQTTSSNLRGQVTDSGGAPIAGATVEIVHVPSGTVARATTGETGAFFQGGLRVGGPYTLTVVSAEHQTVVLEEVTLRPGSQDPLLVEMAAQPDLDRIVVTGARLVDAVELNSGVGSIFNEQDVRNQPSVDRDVIKTLLRDPLASSDGVGNLSVAGANPRFNGLSIDGALQQDDFGLGSNTYATERSPINLDAVESVALVASDYSVTASGFTGGLVNIVTRSGGNEWEGNAYYAYKSDSMIGEKYGSREFDPGEVEEKERGFTVGGPLIEDRLFIFASYDEYKSGSPFDFTNADDTAGRAPGFFDALRSVVQDVYGYDPLGRPVSGNNAVTSERILGKVDWNINDFHRASFTYQSTEETGTSSTAGGFESSWYDIPVDLTAYTFQLFSDWNYNLSTTFRVNYKEFERGQNCRAGAGVGEFAISLDPANLGGTPLDGLLSRDGTVILGCDRFRHANEYNDDRLQLFGSADYVMGDHVLTFGGEWEEFNVYNLFLQNSEGTFIFDDYNSLINRTPSRLIYRNVPSNNVNDGAASWGFGKMSLFAQDQWAVTQDLQVSFGLRYERFNQSDSPAFSQATFDEFGIRTDNNLDGNDLFMPRLGFLYTGFDRTIISGGIGLYAGGNPQVWISNAFQAPFVETSVFDLTNASIDDIPPEALANVAAGTPLPGDYIADDFKTPSDWKASLRYERTFDMNFGGLELGDNYRFTAQYLYTRTKDGFMWRMLPQIALDETRPLGVAPDGRPIYADLRDLGIRNLTELGNLDGNESHAITLALGKSFDSGFDFDVSYAWQDSEVISEGTSSQGVSNWRSLFTTDRNNPSAHRSPFEIEHAFKLSLGFEKYFFGDHATRINAFGQVTSGDVWSPTFRFSSSANNHLFGRADASANPFSNAPMYVPDPAGDSRVVYSSGFDQSGFFDFVDSEDISTGTIVQPYANTSKWNQRWDLRFQQELPGIPGLGRWANSNRFSLILDVENFLNLLDKDWGEWHNGPGFGQAAVVSADLVSAADVAENGIDNATALSGDQPRTVCQSAGDCVYRFNQFFDQDSSFVSGPRSVYQIRLTLRYDF